MLSPPPSPQPTRQKIRGRPEPGWFSSLQTESHVQPRDMASRREVCHGDKLRLRLLCTCTSHTTALALTTISTPPCYHRHVCVTVERCERSPTPAPARSRPTNHRLLHVQRREQSCHTRDCPGPPLCDLPLRLHHHRTVSSRRTTHAHHRHPRPPPPHHPSVGCANTGPSPRRTNPLETTTTTSSAVSNDAPDTDTTHACVERHPRHHPPHHITVFASNNALSTTSSTSAASNDTLVPFLYHPPSPPTSLASNDANAEGLSTSHTPLVSLLSNLHLNIKSISSNPALTTSTMPVTHGAEHRQNEEARAKLPTSRSGLVRGTADTNSGAPLPSTVANPGGRKRALTTEDILKDQRKKKKKEEQGGGGSTKVDGGKKSKKGKGKGGKGRINDKRAEELEREAATKNKKLTGAEAILAAGDASIAPPPMQTPVEGEVQTLPSPLNLTTRKRLSDMPDQSPKVLSGSGENSSPQNGGRTDMPADVTVVGLVYPGHDNDGSEGAPEGEASKSDDKEDDEASTGEDNDSRDASDGDSEASEESGEESEGFEASSSMGEYSADPEADVRDDEAGSKPEQHDSTAPPVINKASPPSSGSTEGNGPASIEVDVPTGNIYGEAHESKPATTGADIKMGSPPRKGSSRTSGGILRGKAIGRVPNLADEDQADLTVIPATQGLVFIYLDETNTPKNVHPISTSPAFVFPYPAHSPLHEILRVLASEHYKEVIRLNPTIHAWTKVLATRPPIWVSHGFFNKASEVSMSHSLQWDIEDGEYVVHILAACHASAIDSAPSRSATPMSATTPSRASSVQPGPLTIPQTASTQPQVANTKHILATALGLPVRSRDEKLTLKASYAYWKMARKAIAELPDRKLDPTWPLPGCTQTDIVDLFIGHSFWASHWKYFEHVYLLEDLHSWMESSHPDPTLSEKVWGSTINPTFADMFELMQREGILTVNGNKRVVHQARVQQLRGLVGSGSGEKKKSHKKKDRDGKGREKKDKKEKKRHVDGKGAGEGSSRRRDLGQYIYYMVLYAASIAIWIRSCAPLRVLVLMAAVTPGIAAPTQPIPDIPFSTFSKVVLQSFHKDISLATVLVILFSILENPSIFDHHSRHKFK
ncbi:hypothetical protein DFP72DRAFT_1108393 [Ephemerocybe angulata]|uniref:Uncharacterized protein n=1 Tax=Ephemerocybe angulata TaxID=980116 RepID=A0A8H6IJU0_9AGAR|nr:hypothetical protein DFP72DRAFT_1108393 [Tulosesus angulatus]